MRTPIRALIWHEWRLCRWPFLAATLLPMGFSLLAFLARSPDAVEVSIVVNCFALAMLTLVLGLWRGTVESLDPGFPQDVLVLPVRTRTLVTVLFAVRLLCVLCAGLLIASATFLCIFKEYEWPSAAFVPALVFPYVIALFLAVGWLLSPLGPVGNGFTTLVLVFPGLAITLAIVGDSMGEDALPLLVILLCAGIPMAYAVALAGASLYRCGKSGAVSAWLAQLVSFRFRGRAKPFSSPMAAQTWYEWRYRAWLLPALSIALTCLLAVPLLVSLSDSRSREDWRVSAALVLITVAPAAAVAAGFLAQNMSSSAVPFLMTRPMRTADLAWARVRAAVRATLAVALPMAVTFVAIALPTLMNGRESLLLKLVFGVGFYLCLPLLVTWILYWFSFVLGAGYSLLGASYAALALFTWTVWGSSPRDEIADLFFGWVPAVAILAMSIMVFVAGQKRGLVSWKTAGMLLIPWVPVTVVSAFCIDRRVLPWDLHGLSLLPFVAVVADAAILAALPPATTAFLIAWRRHR